MRTHKHEVIFIIQLKLLWTQNSSFWGCSYPLLPLPVSVVAIVLNEKNKKKTGFEPESNPGIPRRSQVSYHSAAPVLENSWVKDPIHTSCWARSHVNRCMAEAWKRTRHQILWIANGWFKAAYPLQRAQPQLIVTISHSINKVCGCVGAHITLRTSRGYFATLQNDHELWYSGYFTSVLALVALIELTQRPLLLLTLWLCCVVCTNLAFFNVYLFIGLYSITCTILIYGMS